MIVWESEPVTITADEALALVDLNEDKGNTDWAVEVLRSVLVKGPVLAVNVQKEMKQSGITTKELRRAQKVLGIKPKKAAFRGGWEWSLPGHEDAQESQDAQPEDGDVLSPVEIPNPVVQDQLKPLANLAVIPEVADDYFDAEDYGNYQEREQE